MSNDKEILEREIEHFDNLAENSEESWWGHKTHAGIERLKLRADVLQSFITTFKNDPKTLEIGSGMGTLTLHLLERFPSLDLTCIDISPKSMELCKKKCPKSKFWKVKFDIGDITKMNYKDNTFDLIFGNSILHHVNIEKCLGECFRVLKKGGFIILFEPNMLNPQNAVERNIKPIGKIMQNSKDETAFFRWQLKKDMKKVGFQNVIVNNFDFLHPLTPKKLIESVKIASSKLVKIPVVKEFSGSLSIFGEKK